MSDTTPVVTVTRRSLLLGAGGAAVSAPAMVRAESIGSAPRIAVLGAGVFGTWTAEQLRRRGARVSLLDAAGPAHSRASSGGESRMTRAGYGKDAIYARMAVASLTEWKKLSLLSGLPIFHPTGVLFFFQGENPYLTESLRVHRELGLPTQALSHVEMARRFPMIDFAGVSAGMFEPGFGALMARRSVQTLAQRFQADGGAFLSFAAAPPRPAGDRIDALHSTSGERIEADHFVAAAGPWMAKLFPEVIGRRIVATRQEVFTFAPPPGNHPYRPGAMPGWADFNGGDVYYGFPDLEGKGVKFAHDSHGPDVDPDRNDRRPTDAALAEVVAFRDRRFPGLRGAPLATAEVCQYENSANGDFLIDRHPRWTNMILVGGGSGHGFKHGPEVGRIAAELTLDGTRPDPRFSLATKGTKPNRAVI
ncbi:glycine/D-amino acid oxidase-like deaminating enzyme [Sphingomonas kaistensis]|uniref:Glycine/D-amino acid oxidase-like deaminating enzyme n=1 Tax=Sphingomonas kaistensis TaxID=298708 RepID=A0A7X6BI82_9SPHN|nr:glycine/D-amino acid oxidase-like deaminating enzyme [Sphingomonas kaistensis]